MRGTGDGFEAGVVSGRRWRHRSRAALVGLLSFTLALIGTTLPQSPATAAGTASVTITTAPTTVRAGAVSTLTLGITCGVTGGCAGANLTFPTTSYTNLRGTVVDNSASFGQLSCAGWTRTVTSSKVTYTYTAAGGTLATGAVQCTIPYTTVNYTTPNNQAFPITPTINGTNFTSAAGNTATVTVTAAESVTLRKTAPSQVGQGGQFVYDIHWDCTPAGIAGAIGTSSFSLTDVLPAGFTYISYRTIYNANNGNSGVGAFPGTIGYDSATRTFSYSDPSGAICDGTQGFPGRDIEITGTASSNGTPDPVGATISNTVTASMTYLDGGSATKVAGVSTSVVSVIPTDFVSKTPYAQTLPDKGEYRYPPNNGVYPYTFPGDWNGSGRSAQYGINLITNGVQAGASFLVQDPLPCLSNNTTPGTAANPNYTSNAVGTVCADPAFIPTVVTAVGFTPSAASDSVTVIRTDGSSVSIPYTPGTGWVIPTSPAVSELDFPPFASEGQNTIATMQLIVKGYASAAAATTSVLSNKVTATPFLVSSGAPLAASRSAITGLMVATPTAPSGVVIAPGIWATYDGTSTCTETVRMGNFAGLGPQSNWVEIAQAPSAAIHLSYLAPAGAKVTSGATQTFSFTPNQFAPFSDPTGGAAATTASITATSTDDYNGTGRTLLQWVIPAGTITTPGDYAFAFSSNLSVNLGAGCAGTYQNDVTVGYGQPITGCYPSGSSTPFNGANNALTTTNAPVATNYCGESWNVTAAPINPGFTVDKTVQGNLDPAPVGSGGTGHVSPQSGAATYDLTFTNTGESNLHDPVLYDLLPRVGDTEASSSDPRGSDFPVTLTGVGTLPANVTVSYSTATNPCRPELIPNANNAGCVNDWTTTPPSPISKTTALRIGYTGTVYVGGSTAGVHGFSLAYTVATPAVAAGQTAWNSVGSNVYAGDTYVGAAESSYTGLQADASQPQIVKTASASTYSAAGETITYTFTVTNNTAVTLTGVSVADALTDAAGGSSPPTVTCQTRSAPAAPCSGSSTTLAPGQAATFTAAHTIRAADLDHGRITDQATVTAQPPTGGALTNVSNSVTVTAVQSPAISLQKTSSPVTVNAAGQAVTWNYNVTNLGNTSLTGIAIQEKSFSGTGLSAVTCPAGPVAVGVTVTCTATSTVSQADLDAGSITNTAAASGTSPSGQVVTSADSTATVTANRTPALTIAKTASPTTVTAAGQPVIFRFQVTNTGNVSLSGVQPVEQTFTAAGPLGALACSGTDLAPGASLTCTASYTTTQADIDNGGFANTAAATATAPGNRTVTAAASTATVTAAQSPALTLTKTSTPTSVTAAGDSVAYRFLVRNTGNVTVTGIDVTETAFTGSGSVSAIACPETVLAPGETTTCTADYTVTQADIDRGSIENTAQVTGTDPTGATLAPASSSATVTVGQVPGLTIVKSATPAQVDTAGTVVHYTFQVGNNGNVSVSGIAVKEVSFSGTGTTSGANSLDTPSCPQTGLAPGASMTCTADYTVTQADVDSGSIQNIAVATGTDPGGVRTTSPASSATVTVAQNPALTLVKSADVASVNASGQEVHYTLHVRNAGNLRVTGIVVTERAFSGAGTVPSLSCPQSSLAPDEAMDCAAAYTLVQQDIDSGSLANTAVATGTASNGALVASNDSTVTVPVTRSSKLAVAKTADQPTVAAAGDAITYRFEVTNIGNVTIAGVAPHEKAFTGSGTVSAISCPATTLAPSQKTTCVATYQVTQADVDAGAITNTGDATGTDSSGATVTASDSTVTVTVAQQASLTLTKTADAVTITQPGQPVTFRFHIANTGNVTLTGVNVAEGAFTGAGTLTPTGCAGDLAPGQTADCSAVYTTVQADVDRGRIENTATATGSTPARAAVRSSAATAVVAVQQSPKLTLVKRADRATVSAAGQTIGYTFELQNAGNTTLAGIRIDEKAFSGLGPLNVDCPSAPLAPGATASCTADYAVTAADMTRSAITNTAVAIGTVPIAGLPTTSDPSTATVGVVVAAVAGAAGLAQTGSDALPTLLLATGLILAGAAVTLVFGLRRRRSPHPIRRHLNGAP